MDSSADSSAGSSEDSAEGVSDASSADSPQPLLWRRKPPGQEPWSAQEAGQGFFSCCIPPNFAFTRSGIKKEAPRRTFSVRRNGFSLRSALFFLQHKQLLLSQKVIAKVECGIKAKTSHGVPSSMFLTNLLLCLSKVNRSSKSFFFSEKSPIPGKRLEGKPSNRTKLLHQNGNSGKILACILCSYFVDDAFFIRIAPRAQPMGGD